MPVASAYLSALIDMKIGSGCKSAYNKAFVYSYLKFLLFLWYGMCCIVLMDCYLRVNCIMVLCPISGIL